MIKGWKEYLLKDILYYEQPSKYIVSNTDYDDGGIPVLTAGKTFVLGYTNDNDGIYEKLPVILFDDFLTASRYVNFKFKVKSSAVKMLKLRDENRFNLRTIFNLMQMIKFNVVDHQRHWISQYSKLKIYIPEIEEQNLIADYLSDIDNLIGSLEELIEKKKLIKQGVMQELLTGKKRLPGYNDKWIEERLDQLIIRFATGLNPRQNFVLNNSGSCYYVTIKDFGNNKINFVNCDKISETDVNLINKRSGLRQFDILFSSIGRIGDVYLITEKPKNWNINESVFSLRPRHKNIDPLFLTYKFNSKDLKDQINELTSGSTLKSIKMHQLKKLNLYIPKSKSEQKAIANILFDIDNEILNLEKKLEKYKQIKQGMMEQLLTGKIRLINDEKEVIEMSEKKHNQYFDDAVIFANIVASCYNPGYLLGRKKCQKVMYLFKRFNESPVEQFSHFAAGPYDNKARYGGFETIAIKNKYVIENKSSKGSSFEPGPEIDKAKEYFINFGYDKFLPILNELKYFHVDKLELYTTVDKTILELKERDLSINLDTVKDYILNDKTWVTKLSREVFNDNNIEEAIHFSQMVLGV